MHRTIPKSLNNQRGVASLIFVLLVALVITASTNEAVKSIRNSQEIGTAVNATSHAETGIWVAAEAMRIYLESIDTFSLQALGGDLPIEMGASYGSVTAEDIDVTQVTPVDPLIVDEHKVELLLVNRHATSKSSAKLRVVYTVTETIEPAPPVPLAPTVNFNDNLTVNGGIELLNGGNPINLTVDGDVNIGGVSVNPIHEIHTSGRVKIGSKVTVDSIFADDDVELANTIVQKVRTRGTLTATGSATVVDTIANDDVFIRASGRFEHISSRKNIYLQSGGEGQGVLIAGENIVASQSGSIDSANAVGDIILDGYFNVDYAIAMGDINCVSPNWKDTLALSANGSLNNCPGGDDVSAISGASNKVTPSAELPARVLPKQVIDVWQMDDDVNYFIDYDYTVNRIRVTVNDVNGLDDDEVYHLGKYNSTGGQPPHIDYLCTSVNASGVCTAPEVPTLPLCFGQSLWGDCIAYDLVSNTYTINPNQTVPGIVFFDGNVTLVNGHGTTTILASGNITTQGQFVNWAANRGGYEKICEGNADHAKSSVRERYAIAYSTHYPTNLCDIANGEYLPVTVGNIALAAGGVDPDTTKNPDADYRGGDISLGSSTDVWGAVLAGNFLSTSGNVNIRGIVSAGATGDPDSGSNSLGSKTTIDLQATESYDPFDLPVVVFTPPPPPNIIKASAITWSRPL